ncbi:MAG: type II secretion system F family protein, partial [Nitrospinae bacterium]|nr:type II secretion system F family protein [Nitrospinota bacterium]
MPTFIYKVKTRTGETVGEMAGNSKGEVERLLKKQKIRVVSVKKKKEPMFGNPMPSDRDIVVFTRQFATMIGAGLPLLQCLVILTESTDNKRFQGIIKEAKEAIEKGETLAEGLRKNPKVFDKLFTNMVEAGEIGGSLDTTLSRLAIYKEKAAALKGQVKSAMVYPASIVAIATLVITFLMIAVIPQFAAMFEGSGQSLPLPTAIVMKMSDFVVSYILYAIPLAFLGFLGFKKYYDTTGGKRRVDALLLRLPVFGPLIQKVAVAKFTRTLGTLLKSGVPIIQAVDITGKTAGNKVIEDKIFELIDEIKQGKSL